MSPTSPNEMKYAAGALSHMETTESRGDDRFAAALRGFGPIGLLAILAIGLTGNVFVGGFAFPLGGLLVLAWAARSRTPLRAIGYVTPKSWVVTIVVAAALGVALKLVLKAVVMPLLGADPINATYHHLVGNAAALPAAIWSMFVGAGFGEETVFRGFAFERLRRLLGNSAWAKSLAVVVTSAAFGAAHFGTQGMSGVQQATIVGLVFGTFVAIRGRIWPVIAAHIAFNLTALTIIYFDLESAVAHIVFK